MQKFLKLLKETPESISFEDTMKIIEKNYIFTPMAFVNGDVKNKADENNGSCKLFAFAKLQKLNEQDTLNCFGQYYRQDVLNDPNGDNHQNIRNFIKTGWASLDFKNQALVLKN
ncbi:MAG: HopJ type III effector protein [Pseudomonadota bacterium]